MTSIPSNIFATPKGSFVISISRLSTQELFGDQIRSDIVWGSNIFIFELAGQTVLNLLEPRANEKNILKCLLS